MVVNRSMDASTDLKFMFACDFSFYHKIKILFKIKTSFQHHALRKKTSQQKATLAYVKFGLKIGILREKIL